MIAERTPNGAAEWMPSAVAEISGIWTCSVGRVLYRELTSCTFLFDMQHARPCERRVRVITLPARDLGARSRRDLGARSRRASKASWNMPVCSFHSGGISVSSSVPAGGVTACGSRLSSACSMFAASSGGSAEPSGSCSRGVPIESSARMVIGERREWPFEKAIAASCWRGVGASSARGGLDPGLAPSSYTTNTAPLRWNDRVLPQYSGARVPLLTRRGSAGTEIR